MKGVLYCFKVLGIKDSDDSKFLTNIYKIYTTVRKLPISTVPNKSSKRKPTDVLKYELMFCVEVDEIHKLDIFENLYLYKYMNYKYEDNLYKVEFSKIKNFVTKDLNNLELRKKKLSHINSFLENVLIQKNKKLVWDIDFINSFKSKKKVMENIQIMRFVDLYNIYLKWFKTDKCLRDTSISGNETLSLEKKSPGSENICVVSETRNSKEKAEICEFLELCETYTILGKPNEYYEWEL